MTDTSAPAWRVVIADDDSDIRDLVALAVRRAGLSPVAIVATGDDALAAILEEQPDLAILDIEMPGLNGLDVCRAVRAAGADVRIALLSASVDDSDRAKSLEAGADHFLAKPFSPRELVAWLAVGKEPRP